MNLATDICLLSSIVDVLDIVPMSGFIKAALIACGTVVRATCPLVETCSAAGNWQLAGS